MTSFEALADRVGRLMREVAAEIIVPRFRALKTGDVMEKSPGEVVTIVDHEAERRIEPVLLALRRGSRVVGEEGVA
ncbi:MAG TPA: inositol monophosphatase, partial [Burkholderiaceae bacterium]|nr:inositol monophosphatase [Burkholderiaceae bacterium]